MGSLSDGTYSAAYEVDIFTADMFTDECNMSHYQKDVTLTMGTTSTEHILPNSVHIYSANKEHANAFESLVAQFPIWGELEGFVNVPEDDWMEIPLIPNWESQVPWNHVYKQGLKEWQIIDNCFDMLHKQGCMDWVHSHTLSGYPTFVVYWMVHNPDGTTTKKECVVIDLHSVNKIVEPDIYPLPI